VYSVVSDSQVRLSSARLYSAGINGGASIVSDVATTDVDPRRAGQGPLSGDRSRSRLLSACINVERTLSSPPDCNAVDAGVPHPPRQMRWLLPSVLSVITGSVDTIRLHTLGGLFTDHIAGNLVILAAHYVTGQFGELGPLLSVPVLVAVMGIIALVFGAPERLAQPGVLCCACTSSFWQSFSRLAFCSGHFTCLCGGPVRAKPELHNSEGKD
jgi:hypothetical protein